MPIAHLSDRAVLRVSGADARPFLQDLLTNDVTGALPAYAGLLSAQGKTVADIIVHGDRQGGSDDLLLDVAAGLAEALAKRLAVYRLRRAVVIAADPLQVFARWGAAGGDTPDPRLPGLGERWLAAAQATDASLADYHRHRLALGVPDTAEMADLLWLETNAGELHGVSFTKGCYVGQENTARMHHKEKLRRRLLPLRTALDGPVMAGDREAGELRSRRGDLAMAYLRTEYADAALTVGGAPAALLRPGWLPRAPG